MISLVLTSWYQLVDLFDKHNLEAILGHNPEEHYQEVDELNYQQFDQI